MTEFIENLSTKTEILIVILLSFGYSILASLLYLFGYSMNSTFSNATLLSTIFYEIIILFVIMIFLDKRNNQINYSNNISIIKLLTISFILSLAYYFIYYILFFFLSQFITLSYSSNVIQSTRSISINIFVILLVSLVNPIFEEFIVVGYIIPTVSSQKSISYAINVSVLVRFLYHLYQGPIAAISIIPLGLIFAFVFLKWKNIWPLIIAHGIMDFVGLYYYYGL
jgi:uncharacterized protein